MTRIGRALMLLGGTLAMIAALRLYTEPGNPGDRATGIFLTGLAGLYVAVATINAIFNRSRAFRLPLLAFQLSAIICIGLAGLVLESALVDIAALVAATGWLMRALSFSAETRRES